MDEAEQAIAQATQAVTDANAAITTANAASAAADAAAQQAQTVTSQIMVPTTTAGLRDTQIANGTRIQNDLDAYEPMIRNTGNQVKNGSLTFKQSSTVPSLSISHTGINIENPVSSPQNVVLITMGDVNNVALASFVLQRRADNGANLYVSIRNANGTYKFVNIASGDAA